MHFDYMIGKMKLKSAKRKKRIKIKLQNPFPLNDAAKATQCFTGRFNGYSVLIDDKNEMNSLKTSGFFGKGSLSKSYPCFNIQEPTFLRKRQFEKRNDFLQVWKAEECSTKSVIVVSDSDSDCEDYTSKLNPVLTIQANPCKETLNLMLEETFFLSYALKCLRVKNNNEFLDDFKTWDLFCDTQENFVQSYGVYHYFRSRKWIVKPGLKFGGDFLLYKDGPPFNHASYLVKIDLLDGNLQRETTHQDLMSWTSMIGLNRLMETAAKEVLICQVGFLEDFSLNTVRKSPVHINKLSVNPILMRRWIAKQERLQFTK